MFRYQKPDFDLIVKIMDLADQCGLSVWTENHFREEFIRDDSRQVIATKNKEVVGFSILRLTNIFYLENTFEIKYKEAEILFIAVNPEFQDRGIGKTLLEMILESALLLGVETVWLEVRESNYNAISFYKKNCFIHAYTRHNYFQSPAENAAVMKRNLN